MVNCDKPGMHQGAFDALMKGWHAIVKTAETEREFLDRWEEVKKSLVNDVSCECYPWIYPVRDTHTIQCLYAAFQYIDQIKLPIRHRFASYAINQQLHFGHTTTSIAESAHWTSIKCNLLRVRGTLLDVYDQIDRSTQQRQYMIEDQNARERVELLTLPSRVFEPVLRVVTHHALKLVHEEYKKSLRPQQLPVCSRYYQRAFGLPCAH